MSAVLGKIERRCPACEFEKYRERGQKNGFQIVSCQRCGTLYTSALPATGQDYNEYYSDDNLSVPEFINRRLDEIISEFSPYRQNGRLLDVGFGAGAVLEAAARAGWTALGVEVSKPAAEHARMLGYEVFCGELAAARYPDSHFDVVVASEILEHVPEPRAILHEIARILRPGGLMWATTPHGRGLSSLILGLKWSTISPPEHLHLFSLRGIKILLEAAGFRGARVVTQGVNPFEIWHALRTRQRVAAPPAPHASDGSQDFSRVETSQQFNRFLSESPTRRLLKSGANELLNVGRLGDSLKVWAKK
jgi:SAM-dependent methyltransferase